MFTLALPMEDMLDDYVGVSFGFGGERLARSGVSYPAFCRSILEGGLSPSDPRAWQRYVCQTMANHECRYLIGGYGENRAQMLDGTPMLRDGRSVHLGLDIWTDTAVPVFAPCDGHVVTTGFEDQLNGYGYYALIEPDAGALPFIFMGHLASDVIGESRVGAGDRVGTLGSYIGGENGGWALHLHVQMVRRDMVVESIPLGYCPPAQFRKLTSMFPSPSRFLGLEVESDPAEADEPAR